MTVVRVAAECVVAASEALPEGVTLDHHARCPVGLQAEHAGRDPAKD